MGTTLVILSIFLIGFCLFLELGNPRCSYCSRRNAMKKTGRRRREGGLFLGPNDYEYCCEYCGHTDWL
jgi:hypothetical protein